MVAGDVVKLLGVIHDLDRIAVRQGDGYAVVGGQRGLGDFLGAIGLNNDGHGAGSDLRNGNLHLGGGVRRQGDRDGGGVFRAGGHGDLGHGKCHRLPLLGGVIYHSGGQLDFGFHLAVLRDGGGGRGAVLVVHSGLAGAVRIFHGLSLVAALVDGGGCGGAVLFGFHHFLGSVGVRGKTKKTLFAFWTCLYYAVFRKNATAFR